MWYLVMAALETNGVVLTFLWERQFCIVGKIRCLSQPELVLKYLGMNSLGLECICEDLTT